MWVIFTVLASIDNAIYYMCNQNIRLKPSVFMVYRGAIVALTAIPFLFWYNPITAWQFYAIAVLQGIITAHNDFKSFKANHKYGAETVCSIMPIKVGFTFILWCFIEPMIIRQYAQSPLKSLCIILSLCGIVFALSKYRKVKLSKEAFIVMLPVMILGSFISIFNKTIMNYAEDSLLGLCFWRIFVSSLTVCIIHLTVYIRREKTITKLTAKENLSRCWIFIFMPLSMLLGNLAMFYADNPSYVAALVQISLLWVMLFNRYLYFIPCKKMCMKMDKKWAFLMLTSVIILILATK